MTALERGWFDELFKKKLIKIRWEMWSQHQSLQTAFLIDFYLWCRRRRSSHKAKSRVTCAHVWIQNEIFFRQQDGPCKNTWFERGDCLHCEYLNLVKIRWEMTWWLLFKHWQTVLFLDFLEYPSREFYWTISSSLALNSTQKIRHASRICKSASWPPEA